MLRMRCFVGARMLTRQPHSSIADHVSNCRKIEFPTSILLRQTKLPALYSRPVAFSPLHRVGVVCFFACLKHPWRLQQLRHCIYARVQPFRCRSLYIYCFHTVQPFLAPRKPALQSPSRCSARRLCCMPSQLHWLGLPAVRVHALSPQKFPVQEFCDENGGKRKAGGSHFHHGLQVPSSVTFACGSLHKYNYFVFLRTYVIIAMPAGASFHWQTLLII